MSWTAYDDGASIGSEGTEGGSIVADFDHDLGARITIEQQGDDAPFALTCGIYGWFFHTRFFATRAEADSTCAAMKPELDVILQSIPARTDPDCDAKSVAVGDAISQFVDRFS